jgi:hypothetical protein
MFAVSFKRKELNFKIIVYSNFEEILKYDSFLYIETAMYDCFESQLSKNK